MSSITTRASKGSELTHTELDDNFTNLDTDKLENINSESLSDLSDVNATTPTDRQALIYDPPTSKWIAQTTLNNIKEDTTPQLGGDLDVQNNIITTTGTRITIGDSTNKPIRFQGDSANQQLFEITPNFTAVDSGCSALINTRSLVHNESVTKRTISLSTDDVTSSTDARFEVTVPTGPGFRKVLEVSDAGVKIEDEYTMPLADGTANQVIETDGSGTLSWTTPSSGSATNTFGTIAVSGQSDVVADSTTDTLTLASGSNITLTTDAGTDTVTIASSGGIDYVETTDPVNSTNPASTGATWINKTDGEMFICTDNTANANEWINVGEGTGNIEPPVGAWYGDRAVVFGGKISSAWATDVIEYFDITSTGNASDFGDLTRAIRQGAACSNGARGIRAGGKDINGNRKSRIEYITIATTGDASTFGVLTRSHSSLASCSSNTRGLFGGGTSGTNTSNTIDYITIATAGDASDFGDLTSSSGAEELTAVSDATRGLFAGGKNFLGDSNKIEYVTIATTGNATDFGDLTVARQGLSATGSTSRAIFGGGLTTVSINTIDYVNIQTTGNATDFGDLTMARDQLAATSNATRGVFVGGDTDGTNKDTIAYVTIASAGNATDFGDLTREVNGASATSGD